MMFRINEAIEEMTREKIGAIKRNENEVTWELVHIYDNIMVRDMVCSLWGKG